MVASAYPLPLGIRQSGYVPFDAILVKESPVFLPGELLPVVGDDSEGYTEAGDDVSPNKMNDIGFLDGHHGLGLDPFGEVVGGS